MKKIIVVMLGLILQACVGASFLVSHEGLYLHGSVEANKRDPGFKSILHGYMSKNINDPGNTVSLENSSVEVSSNCYKQELVSVFPSFIVPLPPIIPFFGLMEGNIDSPLIVNLSSCKANEYRVKYVEINKKLYQPSSNDNCSYHFKLMCKDIKGSSEIILEKKDIKKEIKIKYNKTYSFGWAWLSA